MTDLSEKSKLQPASLPDTKPLPSVPALSARGIKSVLSGVLQGLANGTVSPERAQAVSKVAAQMNSIMRTELDAAKLHFEITGKKNDHAMTAIGHTPDDDSK